MRVPDYRLHDLVVWGCPESTTACDFITRRVEIEMGLPYAGSWFR
jgi:hypothetical protein